MALVEDGDRIELDIPNRNVDPATLESAGRSWCRPSGK